MGLAQAPESSNKLRSFQQSADVVSDSKLEIANYQAAIKLHFRIILWSLSPSLCEVAEHPVGGLVTAHCAA
jgi:hypothetical protein